MIEVTDEMVTAWRDGMTAAAAEAVKRDAPLTATREIARAGLAAVLAIVEREYRIEPRPPWEKAPHCPVVNDRCPGNANGWICTEPCDPGSVV